MLRPDRCCKEQASAAVSSKGNDWVLRIKYECGKADGAGQPGIGGRPAESAICRAVDGGRVGCVQGSCKHTIGRARSNGNANHPVAGGWSAPLRQHHTRRSDCQQQQQQRPKGAAIACLGASVH
jgi:hypothetical protein